MMLHYTLLYKFPQLMIPDENSSGRNVIIEMFSINWVMGGVIFVPTSPEMISKNRKVLVHYISYVMLAYYFVRKAILAFNYSITSTFDSTFPCNALK